MSAAFDAMRYAVDLASLELCDPAAAVEIAHTWTPRDLEALAQRENPDGIDLFMALRRLQRSPVPELTPAERIRRELRETAAAADLDARVMDFSDAPPIAETWDSTIPVGHEAPLRYRGLTVIGGDTGLGKSKHATRVSLTACSKPSTAVIYLNAELDVATCWLYCHQVTDFTPEAFHAAFPNFIPVDVPLGCSFERVVDSVVGMVPDDAERLIVVVDTINTLVENCQTEGGDGFFKLMRKLASWAKQSRANTGGKIGWMIMSELSGPDKHITGVKLEKLADVVVRFRDSDLDSHVTIDVRKDRYGTQRDLGDYAILWETCELEKT